MVRPDASAPWCPLGRWVWVQADEYSPGQSECAMTQNALPVWLWLVQTFGSIGAILVLVLAVGIGLSWIMTPVYVWRLSRKSTIIENMLVALTGTQSRRQQVERLQRDRERKKTTPPPVTSPGTHRRAGKNSRQPSRPTTAKKPRRSKPRHDSVC